MTTMPEHDCDLLTGIDQIAQWRGITKGQAHASIARGGMIVFKMPGNATVYASKATNLANWKSLEERSGIEDRIDQLLRQATQIDEEYKLFYNQKERQLT